MSNQWHYKLDGTQYGPVDEVEMIHLIEEGKVSPEVPVCKVGDSVWYPAWDHACFQVEVYPIENPPIPPIPNEEGTAAPSTDDAGDEEARALEYIPIQDVQPPAEASNSKIIIGTAILGMVALVATALSVIFAYKHDRSLGELARVKSLKTANQQAYTANQQAYRSELDALKNDLSISLDNVGIFSKKLAKAKQDLDSSIQAQIDVQNLVNDAYLAKAKTERAYSRLKSIYDADLPKLLNQLGKAQAEQTASLLKAELAALQKGVSGKTPGRNTQTNGAKSVVKNVDLKYGFITIYIGEGDAKKGDTFRVTRAGKFVGTIVVYVIRGNNTFCKIDKANTAGIANNPLVGDIKPGDDVELFSLVPTPASVGLQPPTFPPGFPGPNPPVPVSPPGFPAVPSTPVLTKPITPPMAPKNVVKNIDSKLGLITIPVSENDTKKGDIYRVTRGDKLVGTIVVSTQKEGESYCKVDKTQTTGMDKNPVTGDIKAGDVVELSSTVTALDPRFGFITINYGLNETKKGDVYRILRAGKFVGIIWVHTSKGTRSLCKVDKVHTLGMDRNPRTGSIQIGDSVEPYK